VKLLTTWEPPGGLLGGDRPGLASAVFTAIRQDAAARSSAAEAFIGLPGVYVEAVISAFWQAAQEGAALDWPAVLSLCSWADQQAEAELRVAALTALLPDAPAYPIDALALLVDLLAPTLRDHPLYRQVCDGLDRAVARQEGDAVAGDRCRQRAEALQAAGRPLDALREFHQAKINWFHGDTLYGTLRAMACITDIYAGLGMYLAGKKYALAMASLALSSPDASDRELAPIALFSAANMDHLAGAWAASAELAAVAGRAHLRWAPDPDNLERHAYVTEAIKYQAFAAVIAQQTRPGFLPTIHGILRGSVMDGLARPPAASPAAEPLTEQEWTDRIADKAGAPFSDAGRRARSPSTPWACGGPCTAATTRTRSWRSRTSPPACRSSWPSSPPWTRSSSNRTSTSRSGSTHPAILPPTPT
jgi:hypothetical protein